MSKKEKLLEKFLSKPIKKDLVYQDLETLLNILGYKKLEGEGSRVKFYNKTTEDLIILHKPHPSNILKTYQIKEIQNKLTNK